MNIRKVSYLLYTCPLLAVANIKGHAPGGGTVLALTCNKRVMTRGGHVIGLNEVEVGLPVPVWIIDMFVDACGTKAARDLLPFGTKMNADSALDIGLVDAVADNEEKSWEEVELIFKKAFPLNLKAVKLTYAGINEEFLKSKY